MAAMKVSPLVAAPVLNCVTCNCQGAYLECSVCGSCYCSVECQRDNWPKHRDVCMPRLILAPMIGRSVHLTQFPPPSIPRKPEACLVKDTTNNASLDKSIKENIQPSQNVPTISAKMNVKLDGQKIPSQSVPRIGAKLNVTLDSQKLPPQTVPEIGSRLNGSPGMQKAVQQSSPSNGTRLNGSPSVQKALPKQADLVPDRSPKPESESPKPSATAIALKLNAEKYAPKAEDGTIAGSMLRQGPFPEPGRKVKIAHVASDKMYIYETGPGPNGTPNQFLSLVKSCIEHSFEVKAYFTEAPKVDDIVFAPFEGDYYRAVVKSIGGDNVDVFYPDFGNTQMVAWNHLKAITDPKIKYASTVTHPVWVDNVSSFTPAIKRFLEALVDSAEFVLRTVIEMPKSTIRIVELRHLQEQYLLSDKLLALCSTTPVASKKIVEQKSSPKTPKLVVTNPVTYKPVTVEELIQADDIDGKGVELIILNATSAHTENLLSVVIKSQHAQYEAMMKECQLYGQIDPNPYVPDENEVCLLNVKGTWYRAMMVEMNDDKKTQFYLVDISELAAVDGFTQVRRYPPGLTRKLFLTECILENTEILLKAANGKEENLRNLRGMAFKGDLFKTDESGDSTHVTILCFT